MNNIPCPHCKRKIIPNLEICPFCNAPLNIQVEYDEQVDSLISTAFSSRFQIQMEIGKGGMSTVYKALPVNSNQSVALKIMHPNLNADKEFIERFRREAMVSNYINHPNIVRIYDKGSIHNYHYISMELINGQNLYQHIQDKKRLPLRCLKDWLVPITRGLGYLHNEGLVHRDIKSSNIIIDDKNRAVLTDFGIVGTKINTGLTRVGSVLGTPEYMSPEQHQGKTSPRSDIYSLGVVMYECLTGRLPHCGNTPVEIYEKIEHEPITPPRQIRKDVPDRIENVILRCLRKNPRERFKTCEDLIQALKSGESRIKTHINSKPNWLNFTIIIIIFCIVIFVYLLLVYMFNR